MPITAINTVAIHAAPGQSATLLERLHSLIDSLQYSTDCSAYSLTRCNSASDAWIITGYWHSAESLAAHLATPCLEELFSLTAERLVSCLQFATYRLSGL